MTRFAALMMIAVLSASQTTAQTDPFDFAAGGRIQEFVVSVSNIERTRAAFTDVLKWRVIEQGKTDPSVSRLWSLDVDTPIKQVLVGNAESKYGYVRLVEIDRPDRQIIRPGGRWWDTGGMFNFNVLVRNLDATIAGLRQLGWTSAALPEIYERPGNVRGKSMIMIGPDDIVVSFQERQSPPLQGWPPFDGASHIEVGYQVVTDVARWFEFYTGTLGFPAVGGIRDSKSDKPLGQNSYGLPHNLVGVMDGRQANIRPRDKMEQSLGARQFPNAEGHDFSDRARPPNLGIISARLPVPDILAMREKLMAAKADIVSDLQVVKLSPYGDVRALAVRSPGGSGFWLELFQPGAKPMTESELKTFTKNGRFSTWIRFNKADSICKCST